MKTPSFHIKQGGGGVQADTTIYSVVWWVLSEYSSFDHFPKILCVLYSHYNVTFIFELGRTLSKPNGSIGKFLFTIMISIPQRTQALFTVKHANIENQLR